MASFVLGTGDEGKSRAELEEEWHLRFKALETVRLMCYAPGEECRELLRPYVTYHASASAPTPPLLQVIEATTQHLRSGHARNAILLLQELFVLFAVARGSGSGSGSDNASSVSRSSSSLKTAAEAAGQAGASSSSSSDSDSDSASSSSSSSFPSPATMAVCGASTIGALVTVAGGVNPRFIISAAVAALARAAASFPRMGVALAMVQPRFVWPRNRCVSLQWEEGREGGS